MLNFDKLEQQIAQQMQSAKVPNLALAIVQNQEVIYARGFGVTSIEASSVWVTPETLFRIGGVTQSLTGTAVMRLVESGKLDLDCSVKKYVPWLTFKKPGTADKVTLRMLLSHTSGLPYDFELYGSHDSTGLAAYVREKMSQYRFVTSPGKLVSYSSPGISLAGYIAEVVSDKPFTKLMQELVFDPLDMRQTTFDPTVAKTYPLAQAHTLSDDGELSVDRCFADNVAYYPEAFAFSTVLDLANFAQMQMNQGIFQDQPILSRESVSAMQTPQADFYMARNRGFGLTFLTEKYKGVHRVFPDFGIQTFRSKLVIAPAANVAVVMLFNTCLGPFMCKAQEMVNQIFDQLLDLPPETSKPQAVEPDRSLWSLYTGSYFGNRMGLGTIQVVDDQLTLDWNGRVVTLDAFRKDVYFGQEPDGEAIISVGFIPEAMEPTQHIMVNGVPCQRFEQDGSFTPKLDRWRLYVGTYKWYDTGPYEITVRLQDSQLFLYSLWDDQEVPLIALDETRFVSDWGLFEFQVSEDSKVTGVKWRESITYTRIKQKVHEDTTKV